MNIDIPSFRLHTNISAFTAANNFEDLNPLPGWWNIGNKTYIKLKNNILYLVQQKEGRSDYVAWNTRADYVQDPLAIDACLTYMDEEGTRGFEYYSACAIGALVQAELMINPKPAKIVKIILERAIAAAIYLKDQKAVEDLGYVMRDFEN